MPLINKSLLGLDNCTFGMHLRGKVAPRSVTRWSANSATQGRAVQASGDERRCAPARVLRPSWWVISEILATGSCGRNLNTWMSVPLAFDDERCSLCLARLDPMHMFR